MCVCLAFDYYPCDSRYATFHVDRNRALDDGAVALERRKWSRRARNGVDRCVQTGFGCLLDMFSAGDYGNVPQKVQHMSSSRRIRSHFCVFSRIRRWLRRLHPFSISNDCWASTCWFVLFTQCVSSVYGCLGVDRHAINTRYSDASLRNNVSRSVSPGPASCSLLLGSRKAAAIAVTHFTGNTHINGHMHSNCA